MSHLRTVHRVCPFCEASCGLAVEVQRDLIVKARGDREDPFSRGYICPKAHALKELHHDPDRLKEPVRRTATGWEAISSAALPALLAASGAKARRKRGSRLIHDARKALFDVGCRPASTGTSQAPN